VIRKSGLAIAGIVFAVTLGLAAWKGASAETWAGSMLLTTCCVLMLSAIGAVCRGSDERPRFAGFALFGWGYFALARWYTFHQGPLPTVCWLPGSGDIHNDLLVLPPAVRIAHDAWALAFAALGSVLAGRLSKYSSARKQKHANQILASAGQAVRWRRPAFAGPLGIGLVVAAMLTSWRWGPETGASTVFLLTLVVLGLAILGAVCTRGRRREAWIGAASFGIGYLTVAFGSVVTMALPTDHFLNAIFRPDGPTAARERLDDDLTTDAESQRVRQALREPITLHFPEHTSLKIVVEHIKTAIQGSLGRDLVLYAGWDDWVYLPKEIDKSMVTIDRANIPAEDALNLCLSQIGLTYRVQSGYVRIVVDAYQPLPFEEDPVMIAGHSLLALLAAAFGSVGALFVAGLCGRHRADS
jgi:hypothetical protein